MQNTKTIILGIIAVLILGGVIWYAGFNNNPEEQTGAIKDKAQDQNLQNAQIDDFVIGNPNAPVTIEEFSSHFCGHCISYHDGTLPLIMKEYVETGKVKIIPYYVSPIEIGLGLVCAQEQGKFREYNDYLFARIDELNSVDDLKPIAGELGMDQDSFSQCFDREKYLAKVESWFTKANEKDVSGTPTFFINGEKLVGNQSFSVFQEKIEQELAN